MANEVAEVVALREMGTRFPEFFAALAALYDRDEVKVRSQGGRQLHYVTARTVMNRLDNICGPENWWDEYHPVGEHAILCVLTIRLPDGTLVTKADAGGAANMQDEGDGDKAGFSDALKRAAVKFGVSRYLYRDGVPDYFRTRTEDVTSVQYRHEPEREPGRDAQDDDEQRRRREAGSYEPARTQDRHDAPRGQDSPPRTGKALFAWVKRMEEEHQIGLLKYLNNWAKLQDFPGRMVDWDADQVALAHAEAGRKIQGIGSPSDDGF